MIRRATIDQDERLNAIVRAIVDGVRPTRVILFGSRARGDAKADSDYDLVVELEFERTEYYAVLGRVSQAARSAAAGATLDVLIRGLGEIERKSDDPGYTDWDIAREGVLLYGCDPRQDASFHGLPNRARVREDYSYESINAWLERIDQDLRTVEMALERSESAPWGAAGFHAQQAAEKYLKILFIQRGTRPPRTHQVDELIEALRQMSYELPLFESESKLLNRYAVTIRYPEQAPLPSELEGREVIAAAWRIIESARGLMAV
jgi:HEPN domain-containing protein/predicted nucleotidyltransferase